MKIIGITGNIGSGKSSVARLLEEKGAVVIDADKVGHEIYAPGTEGWQVLVDNFGAGIVSDTGAIDRKKLSGIVFDNPEAVARLNRILHPLIRKEIEKRIDSLRQKGAKVVVIEATLLIEAGWRDMVDELWLVTAPVEISIARLKSRGLSEAEALARLAAQPPPEKKAHLATVIIRNDGTVDELRIKVDSLWDKIHNECKT